MTITGDWRSRKILDFRTISSPWRIGWNFLKHNFVQKFTKPFLPRAMCVYVTYRCNMRCRMCGIWKKNTSRKPVDELSIPEFDAIVSDPLFRKLEYVNINGGEPNLRDDLLELVELFIRKFKHLRTITINSNGLPSERTVSNTEQISRLAREKGIRFSISVSLHKVGPGYDEIAGINNAYASVSQTLRALKDLRARNRFYLGVNCVITNLNVFDLGRLLEWSDREKVPVNFTFGEVRERFNNMEMKDNIEVQGEGRDILIRFFRELGGKKSLFNQHAMRYWELAEMLEFNKKRTLSCYYAMGGLILGSEGSLYYCKKSKAIGNCRERSAYEVYYDKKNLKYRKDYLLDTACRRCPPNTFNRFELEKDLFNYAKFVLFQG